MTIYIITLSGSIDQGWSTQNYHIRVVYNSVQMKKGGGEDGAGLKELAFDGFS